MPRRPRYPLSPRHGRRAQTRVVAAARKSKNEHESKSEIPAHGDGDGDDPDEAPSDFTLDDPDEAPDLDPDLLDDDWLDEEE